MAGGGSLTLTGQLGDVDEGVGARRLSWLRAHAKTYGIDPDFFTKAEMHVHVPAGAIPEGRPVGRRDDGDGDGVGADGPAGPRRRRDDRRDHAVGPGAADRRRQGEGARGAPRSASAK